MENKYIIKYLPTFNEELNSILYYFVNELKNKNAAENLYKEVFNRIERRSFAPNAFKVFKTTKKGESWYRIQVKKFTIFYVVKNNIMEVRRILYNKRNFGKLI